MNRTRTVSQRRSLTACAYDEHGRLVFCTDEVMPRLEAVVRSRAAGQHAAADELLRHTERIVAVHAAEARRGAKRTGRS